MHWRREPLALVLGIMWGIAAANAQEPSQPELQDQRWQQVYQREAASYQFVLQGPQREKLQLHPTSVMRWVSLNDFNGSVFVWTRQGRPELVGTIFSFPRGDSGMRNVLHEFHSFSDQPIEASINETHSWSFPTTVELKPIPAAPPPGPAAAQRQLQARLLAREFSAHMDRQGERWELRLLNQPIFSYSDTSDEVLGGAVFAFVGYITDPEILLLIEARQTVEGPKWFYAPARFSDKSLWLNHKQAEVWQFLESEPTDSPYFLSPLKAIALDDVPE